jgi:DNA-directed RNA polymerase subunit delta
VGKKRIIKKYEQLPEDLLQLLKEKYPDGFEDNLITFENIKGEIEIALPLETEEVDYLIKMPKNNMPEDDEEYDSEPSDNNFDALENLEIVDDSDDMEDDD